MALRFFVVLCLCVLRASSHQERGMEGEKERRAPACKHKFINILDDRQLLAYDTYLLKVALLIIMGRSSNGLGPFAGVCGWSQR